MATDKEINQRGTFPFSSGADLSEKHIQEYNNELKQLIPAPDKCETEPEQTNKIAKETQIYNENEVLKTNSHHVVRIGSIRKASAENDSLLPNNRNENEDRLHKASQYLETGENLSCQKSKGKQRHQPFCISNIAINLLVIALTNFIIHYFILPIFTGEKYQIESTTLHIKWDELQHEKSFIPWVGLNSTFISINGSDIFVKEDGFYIIHAIFNLDSSNESNRNRDIKRFYGLLCLRSGKREVCQKSILANGTALTVPLSVSSTLTINDKVSCSVIGASLISRNNAASYLEITKFPAR